MSRGRIAVAAASALALAGCATSLGDQLGTRVQGAGSQVTLAWVPEHAWDVPLGQRGATLYAEYPTATQSRVSERLASGRGGASRTIRFALPDTLRAVPTGPVCLVLQLEGTGTLLPVRRGAAGRDPARMRFASWEAGLADRTQRRVAQQQAAALASQVDDGRQQLAEGRARADRQRAALVRAGVPTPEACTAVRVATLPAQAPYDVLPAAQHDDTARRVCVHRVRHWVDRFEARGRRDARQALALAVDRLSTVPVAMAPVMAGFLRQPAPPGDAAFDQRRREAADFQRDWTRWRGQTGPDYQPHVGAPDDPLQLTAYAADLHARFLRAQADPAALSFADGMRDMSPREQLGLVGGLLDAYGGCVNDVRRQLGTKLDAWTALQREGPQRERLRQEFVAGQCRADHAALAALETRLAALERDIAQARTAASARADEAARMAAVPVAAIGTGSPVDLNAAPCPP